MLKQSGESHHAQSEPCVHGNGLRMQRRLDSVSQRCTSPRRSAAEFPEVSVGMWDFAAGYYAANLTAEQRDVADRNGFPQKIPAPNRRNNGVAGAISAAAPASAFL